MGRGAPPGRHQEKRGNIWGGKEVGVVTGVCVYIQWVVRGAAEDATEVQAQLSLSN